MRDRQVFQGSIRSEHALVLGNLAELAVISFDRIDSLDDPPDMRRVPEVRAEPVPVLAPAPDDYRIRLAPLDLQVIKCLFRCILVHRLIHLLQILHKLLLPLADHILDRVADLVHDAELDVVSGETLAIASGKPLNPSTQAMRISCTPLFWRSVRTPSQKSAPSLLEMYMPRSFFLSSGLRASTSYMALVTGRFFSSMTL